jgi:tetratricopeptide (TPR) repeat protein
MLAVEPHDAFTQYAVAMELARLGRSADAVDRFKRVIQDHPDYAAAYFMCGRTLEQMDSSAQAADMYRAGIAAARRTGDEHAAGEMTAALDALAG